MKKDKSNQSDKFIHEKVVKIGKITVTIRSNEPSEKAMRNFNRELNKVIKTYRLGNDKENFRNQN